MTLFLLFRLPVFRVDGMASTRIRMVKKRNKRKKIFYNIALMVQMLSILCLLDVKSFRSIVLTPTF